MDIVNDDFNLWILLVQARNAMLKARRQELTKYRLSPRDAAILYLIHSAGGSITPTEIARFYILERHTVSGQLSRMVAKGLVQRSKDLGKKGRINILLTEKGEKLYEKACERVTIKEIMSTLSKSERRQLGKILKKIRDRAITTAVSPIELSFF